MSRLKSFLIGFFLAAALLIVMSFLTGCATVKCQTEPVMVMKVGGCNAYGFCGALLANGEVAHLYYPVEGQFVDRCKSQ